jgi:GNAT superfamily N-acetyltransferase
MGRVQIHPFTPDDGDAVLASLEVRNTAAAVDAPWRWPELPAPYTALLRHGWDGEPERPYLATVDGRVVGAASLELTERDNTHLAWLGLTVLPECRRRGYGTQLFEAMVAEAREAGRRSVGADGWDNEGVLAFARKVGLERRSQALQRRQHLAELAPGLVQRLYDGAAAASPDYELVRLPGRTPAGMVDAMVELVSAINDAPTDDLDVEDEVSTPERLRAYEDGMLARGGRVYRLVARHRKTGALGGHTVVHVEGERPHVGHQHDTAVARAHRGHRLGLRLKAGMVLWLAEAEPQVRILDTWNAESNGHMISVNEALGYRVMGRQIQFQKALC